MAKQINRNVEMGEWGNKKSNNNVIDGKKEINESHTEGYIKRDKIYDVEDGKSISTTKSK